jgi:hypothetical protein
VVDKHVGLGCYVLHHWPLTIVHQPAMCSAKLTTAAAVQTAATRRWQQVTSLHPPFLGLLCLLYERLQVWPTGLALLLPAGHQVVHELML